MLTRGSGRAAGEKEDQNLSALASFLSSSVTQLTQDPGLSALNRIAVEPPGGTITVSRWKGLLKEDEDNLVREEDREKERKNEHHKATHTCPSTIGGLISGSSDVRSKERWTI